MTTMVRALGLLILLAALAPVSGMRAQSLTSDPFVGHVLGEWDGTGEYDGNTLSLSREWTLELGDAFLRADLGVRMPNGASFGALMYWKPRPSGVYEVIWMDGTGRLQPLSATRDAGSGIVSATFLDELAEPGVEWRTWEFESQGGDAYVERLYRHVGARRELLTVFRFERR